MDLRIPSRRTRTSSQRLSVGLLMGLSGGLSISLATAPDALADDAQEGLDAAHELEAELGEAAFDTPAALCRAYVAAAVDALAASSSGEREQALVARAPRCVPEPLPLPFAGDRTWRSLRVLHADDGIGRASRLAVETPRGFVLLPVAWDATDPRDPGCPSIVRDVAIDGATVQHGHLVVVMAGERMTVAEPVSEDDTGARQELVRVPYWSSGVSGGSVFKSPDPWVEGAVLGTKVQPGGPHDAWVPWATIPWSGHRTLAIDAEGLVRSAPTRAGRN